MPTLFDDIFKAYDVRGLVPEQLDVEGARRIGAAFATFVKAPEVIIARDMRPSGIELSEAFADGVTSTGTNVIDIGMISTDMLYFACGFLNAPGATFTASHNPAQYNGIKMCLAGAAPIGVESGLVEIKQMAIDGVNPSDKKGTVTRRDLIEDFAKHVIGFIDTNNVRPLKVVADTANGMGGLVAPPIFAQLPISVDVLFPELDGTFPNHPADPIQPENLRDLEKRIAELEADIGLAFDGDADRVFLVDEKSQPVPGTTVTAMVAESMLKKNPGATILYNVICSRAVPELVERDGGKSVRTRVGHSYIKAVMKDTGAVFGGEHSGHYYFRDNYRADSGIISAVIVLELLSLANEPLSEFRKKYEPYAQSGEINTVVSDIASVTKFVCDHYSDCPQDTLDGVTVDCGDWWFNLRPSNTEPLLRLNVEAPNRDECDKRTAEVIELINEAKGES